MPSSAFTNLCPGCYTQLLSCLYLRGFHLAYLQPSPFIRISQVSTLHSRRQLQHSLKQLGIAPIVHWSSLHRIHPVTFRGQCSYQSNKLLLLASRYHKRETSLESPSNYPSHPKSASAGYRFPRECCADTYFHAVGTNSSFLSPIFLNYLANIRERAGQGPIVRVGGNSQDQCVHL